MNKRILAWIMLAGFVFLIANIIVIHYQTALSALIYIFVVLLYLFGSKKKSE